MRYEPDDGKGMPKLASILQRLLEAKFKLAAQYFIKAHYRYSI